MSSAHTSFTERVHRLVHRIPAGQVSTYGDIARYLGTPTAARGVARALSALPSDTVVPWWRVVNAAGTISLKGYAGSLQRSLLSAEGVRFGSGGRIDRDRYGWKR